MGELLSMKRKQSSIIFLKAVIFLIGIAVLTVCIFASSVIATFAAVLQRLLQDAIDIKSENDLTV